MKYIFFSLLLLISSNSYAEIYKDFKPYISLQEIKNNYPNAKFEDLKAAWVKSDEIFISMIGVGIAGKIYLKMSTLDSVKRNSLEKIETEHLDKESEEYKQQLALVNEYLNKPFDERVTLDWLRWIPDSNIPFERIESRYGKPEACGYDEATFVPYCSWESKGIQVYLSDNKKTVSYIEYLTTLDDIRKSLNITDAKPSKSKEKPKSTTKQKNKKDVL